MSQSTDRPNVSAGAVICDEQGRVLIVNPVYKPRWNLPGGGVGADEDPKEACRREVLEELALDLEIGRLLVHATLSVPGREPHEYFVFDGGVLTAAQQQAIRLQESELGDFRFSRPEDITDEEIPPAARRMWDAALAARAGTETIELAITP
ncbi:NUDIX domain-containing protein [Streptomyces sp. NPDC059802]|uniref:NUDIX domain-containing protein n=1 Tax=Streptomyces sp. NPDC059802 TaxID=3346952 RepID=UPI00365801E9